MALLRPLLGRPPKSLKERFLEKLDRSSACWMWTGSVCRRYGQIRGDAEHGFKMLKAHRVSYELFVGPIPADKDVCHKCDVEICMNPDHLWLGTDLENKLDKQRKGRDHWSAAWSNSYGTPSVLDKGALEYPPKEKLRGTQTME